jgi:DNA polymerase elongation subunit (family B)
MQLNISDQEDKLLNGKNVTEKIVNVEINNSEAILFIQTSDGSVKTEVHSHRYWILYPNNIPGSKRLEGNLHYKYGKQFSTRKDWFNEACRLKKKQLDHFTIWDDKEQFLVKDGFTFHKGMKHTDPSILSFDIESTGLFHNSDSKILLISNTFRKNGEITRKLFCYDEFSSQGEMLTEWCNWVVEMDPSIIAGHNIYTFDFPYIQYIADEEGIELNLGRDGSAVKVSNKSSKFRIDGSRDQEYHKVRIYGREVIDTMFLAIKHDIAAKKYESYGLKSIIKTEGLEKHDRQHYDSSTIRFNYKSPKEWEKIKEYCIHDSDDALSLYDLCSPSSFYLTQSVPKSFQSVVETATGSQINAMMIRSYLQEGHSLPKTTPTNAFEGAISFGRPGIYKNVHKIDVASLYPSIILECKVYDEDKDPKGNFLKIIEQFTMERLKNKKLAKETGDAYYDGLQNAQKIVINSGYGFMGAPGLMFNSSSAAEFITKTGREILNRAISWAEAKSYLIPNADTDSISYTKYDQSEITKEEKEENLQEVNALFPEKIKWEDDGYYLNVIIMRAKNYVLFDGKKVKIKGSALKATGKSAAMKEMINTMIQSILDDKHDFQDIYLKYIKEAKSVTDMKRWAARKTISDKTLNSERTNEVRIKNALEGSEHVEGDRIWVYNKTPTELALVENFDGIYDLTKLVKSVYDTSRVFENILDCDNLFKNYSLKKNKKELEIL